jgi:glycosyltransferase involved in cell wall biosynthesis
VVADIDDPDALLSRERLAARPLKHLKLTPLDDRHPWRSDRVLRAALGSVDVLSVSSWALRDRLPAFYGPVACVPHARPPAPYTPPTPSARVRLGFLGTPRAHKGLGVLLDILAARDDTELHLLEGTTLPRSARSGGLWRRIVFHAHVGPETLARAFRQIDVVVLPQDPDSPAGGLQLPAKLVDALRFGRPVVATATPAIREIAGDAFLPVTRWSPLDEALGHLARLTDRATREAIGRRGAAYFRENLTAEVVARRLRPILERLAAPQLDAAERRHTAGVGR